MIDIQEIKKVTTDSNLIKFAEYVISESVGNDFPDYNKVDLMMIPRLVSHIWAFDFRNGLSDGLLYHFSGSEVDERYGQNVMGCRLEDVYEGDDLEELVEGLYYPMFTQKKLAYSLRNIDFKTRKMDHITRIETLMFPCSSDGKNIDFALGCASYGQYDGSIVNQYLLLG